MMCKFMKRRDTTSTYPQRMWEPDSQFGPKLALRELEVHQFPAILCADMWIHRFEENELEFGGCMMLGGLSDPAMSFIFIRNTNHLS